MKKIIYLITGFVFLASISFLHSQSITKTITVTNPGNGAAWQKDTANLIEWRFTGEINRNVKIRLFNGPRKIKNITNSTPTRNGNFRCPPNFFDDVPDGNYSIRVKTVDNETSDDSVNFTIGTPPTPQRDIDVAVSPDDNSISNRLRPLVNKLPELKKNLIKFAAPSIKITLPKKDDSWQLGRGNLSRPFPIKVIWEKTGIGSQDENVKIFLNRVLHGRQVTLLTQRTSNNGFFGGSVRRDLRTSLYTITIQTLDGKIRVESDTFYITNAENDPH